MMLAAAALPILLLVAGGAVNFASVLKQRHMLQAAADAAAIAGAKSLSLSDAERDNVGEIVKAVVASFVDQNTSATSGSLSVRSEVRSNPTEVSVDIAQAGYSVVDLPFGFNVKTVRVHSTARVVGQPNICVLGLSRFDSGTISLEKAARVTGEDCAVFSNSSHTNSITSKNSAVLTASFICARGGKDGGKGNFNPDPMLDCPEFEDPLAGRPEPTVGACGISERTTIDVNTRLAPGVHCGGLIINRGARLELLPGVHVFKDGQLWVRDGASLVGKGVGLFFTGKGASMKLDRETTISLEAPKTGVMAGLLFFSARSLTHARFEILSDDARTLLGTIYLPNAELHIDAGNPIADKSAYTAIIADTMRLYGGPHLILNTRYNESPVPVPGGIKGVGQPITLVE
nr:pilus assembly protein TadG-related protein [uncultured Brevundimonas sp.]